MQCVALFGFGCWQWPAGERHSAPLRRFGRYAERVQAFVPAPLVALPLILLSLLDFRIVYWIGLGCAGCRLATRNFPRSPACFHSPCPTAPPTRPPSSCMPAYVHPTHGCLNLATHLPWYTRLPDLGPKGYIAFGRWVGGW